MRCRLLEAPALVEQDRPLGVEQVEDVDEEVDRRPATSIGIAEVEVRLVVVRRAAFGAALGEEELVAAVGVGVAVAGAAACPCASRPRRRPRASTA